MKEEQDKLADDLGEEMQCSVCIDYIYQCVTVVPCLHNFCAACYCDWTKKSNMCPSCRDEVTDVKKNPTINNIIDKFLQAHPEKKRSKEEYEEMDRVSKDLEKKIKEAAEKSKNKKKQVYYNYDDGDEDEDEDEDEDDDQCIECKTARRGDGFKCDSRNKNHLTCMSCVRPFPNRTSSFK
mmetsp:Transcript_23903/g.20869  ORF Transcript_23903/g.20869 Transcript_23903/m.20869 type:complete len:180 (+) Transcript_23903:533-1072(+)